MVESKGPSGFKSIAYGLITFSLPLILSGILQQLYNWADAFIVGNVEGERALAAVGATSGCDMLAGVGIALAAEGLSDRET